MNEVWASLNEVSGYSISNLGRIRRDTKDVLMPNGFYRHLEEKIMTPLISNRGYLRVTILHKKYSIHRLVATYFVANPNNSDVVNHIDGNKQNNIYTNLEWVSYKENINHALKNGLRFLHGNIYNEECKDIIKKLLDLGVRPYLISKIFNYSNGQIYWLIRKYSWSIPKKNKHILKVFIPKNLYEELITKVQDNTELINLIAKGRLAVQSIGSE